MSNLTDLIDRYIAIWNETDGERRRALIARTWTETASYLDPHVSSQGQADIDAMIEAIQQRFPDHRFRRAGDVDAHNNRVRFSWELAPAGSPAVARGTDFGVVAADHRLETVTGFLDQVPV